MPPVQPSGGGNVLTRKFGPLPGWAWGAIGVAGYFIYKARKANSTTAANSSTTGTGTGVASPSPLPFSYYQAPSGYTGGASPTGAMAATGGSSSGTAPTTGTNTPSPTLPGLGQITIGNTQYDILGQITGGTPGNAQFSGYNVGGGAPVFFGNANAVAQGPQAETVGSYAYTPSQYGTLIGTTPVSGETIH